MNDLDAMIDTSERKTAAPAAASKGAYLGLVLLVVVFVSVFWLRARR